MNRVMAKYYNKISYLVANKSITNDIATSYLRAIRKHFFERHIVVIKHVLLRIYDMDTTY